MLTFIVRNKLFSLNRIEFSNFVWWWCVHVCVCVFAIPFHSVSVRYMWYQQLNAVITTKSTVYLAKQNQTKNHSKCQHTNEKLYLNTWIWSEKMSVDIFLSTALPKTNKLFFDSFSIRFINYSFSLAFYILFESNLMARKCLYDFQLNIDRFVCVCVCLVGLVQGLEWSRSFTVLTKFQRAVE